MISGFAFEVIKCQSITYLWAKLSKSELSSVGADSVWQQIRHCGHWSQKVELKICLNAGPVNPGPVNSGPVIWGSVGVTDKVQKSQSQVVCLNMKEN